MHNGPRLSNSGAFQVPLIENKPTKDVNYDKRVYYIIGNFFHCDWQKASVIWEKFQMSFVV